MLLQSWKINNCIESHQEKKQRANRKNEAKKIKSKTIQKAILEKLINGEGTKNHFGFWDHQ